MTSHALDRELKVKFQGCTLGIEVVPDSYTVKDFILHKIPAKHQQTHNNESFCVVDLGQLPLLHHQWKLSLPDVQPFYAVKVYNDPLLIKMFAHLGIGFDCASLNEIETVLGMGVHPDRIIYAHPCKMVSHLKYAAQQGVRLMTFDSESELQKVKKFFPSARLVVRIRVAEDSASPFGRKFGCDVPMANHLIDLAFSLNLEVVGVSFHVGSGCLSSSCYQSAIQTCTQVFQHAASVGYKFSVLDIGGGFPGGDNMKLFRDEATAIHQSLEQHFNRRDFPDLKIIAEPGRYFTTTLASNAVCITNVRTLNESGSDKMAYYITDGVHGSMSCALSTTFVKFIPLLVEENDSSPKVKSIVWGPTLGCHGYGV